MNHLFKMIHFIQTSGVIMQPFLMIRSVVPGLVYLNGRMIGEVDAEHTLSIPVSPTGALFVELRPFSVGFLPLIFRMPISRGVPILPTADARFSVALWPDDLMEVELMPERMPAQPQFLFRTDSIRFFFIDAQPPALRCDTSMASYIHNLPDDALAPALTPLSSALMMSGNTKAGEQYALLLTPDASSVLLTLVGQNLSIPDDGSAVRILRPAGDSVGHAWLETWAATAEGWRLAQSEPMWTSGAPAWPQTAEGTALAVVEAVQLGLMNEVTSYVAPLFSGADVLSRLAEFDGCTPLRFPMKDGSTAVGVTQLKGGLLRVVPLHYRASVGGVRGLWQIDSLKLDEIL